MKVPSDPSEAQQRLAQRFGYSGLFSHRTTLQEAHNDALSMIEGAYSLTPWHARTALQLTINTNALLMAQRIKVVDELRELARATQAFVIDGSKSERRRRAMLDGVESALKHAQETFGDES